METQTLHHLNTNLKPQPHMTLAPSLFSKLTLFQALKARAFNSSSPLLSGKPLSRVRVRVRAAPKQLKSSWLDSLSCPLPNSSRPGGCSPKGPDLDGLGNVGLDEGKWVVGIDPDVSGAVALLRPEDGSSCSAQVFDSPHLPVMVGKRVRKRLDVKSIVQLLHSFDAPYGTTAYIEQSLPFPQDGKLGWWGGGFNYGLWIGALIASGFSVVPVPSFTWKNQFQLSGNGSTKDDSRRIASTLFPPLSSSLQRKKDHGRAEALLIASYGKDLNMKSVPPSTTEQLPQCLNDDEHLVEGGTMLSVHEHKADERSRNFPSRRSKKLDYLRNEEMIVEQRDAPIQVAAHLETIR